MHLVMAAGGVLYRRKKDPLEVALIFRNEVWDLPKGHREPPETIEECAVRETAEELGIAPPDIEGFLGKTYHEYIRNGQDYGKTTFWFSMQARLESKFRPQIEEGITNATWVNIAEAREKVGYENLKKVLAALNER